MKKIDFIVNPASGQFEPILSYINQAVHKKNYEWDIFITKEKDDGITFAKQSVNKGSDIVAVYGGDGTVLEVAQGLCGTKTPLAIIPGGTANILAKELLIPTDTQAAIEMITSGRHKKQSVDMGQIGVKKFLNRVNFGIAADMLKSTDRKSKRNLGQLAYGVSMVKHMHEATKTTFSLTLDGERRKVEGVALIVTNAGNVGIPGYSLVPNISITDGKLDVILIPESDIKSVVSLAKDTIMQQKPEETLEHWQAKHIIIETDPSISVVNDDEEIQSKKMTIKILPKSLQVLVPKTK